jgi:enoyl-CoA hydratase/carnithine racemase
MAKRMYVGYETLKGPELLTLGYLDHLVPFTELKPATDRYADRIAGLAPLAVQGMKRALNQIARGRLDENLAKETIRNCMASEDAKEGPRAFAEKRKPVFHGR